MCGFRHTVKFRRTVCQNCFYVRVSRGLNSRHPWHRWRSPNEDRPPIARSRRAACLRNPLVSKLFLAVTTSRFGQLRYARKRADHPVAAQMALRSSTGQAATPHGTTLAILETRVVRRERPRGGCLHRITATRFFTRSSTKDIVSSVERRSNVWELVTKYIFDFVLQSPYTRCRRKHECIEISHLKEKRLHGCNAFADSINVSSS